MSIPGFFRVGQIRVFGSDSFLPALTEHPWKIRNVMKDVHEMLQQADHIKIRHIYLEANVVADWLSKYGHAITGNLLTT